MTLVAAWRCQDGILVSADAQETCGDYRVSVQKIVPETMGNFQVIVAGSGTASLIESFGVVLAKALNASAITSIPQFTSLTEEKLREFFDVDVRLCIVPDKSMDLFTSALARNDPPVLL